MQRQPISIEQTEIGNSLACIDPVTLKLATQHRRAANQQSVCVRVCVIYTCAYNKESTAASSASAV